jgi:Flp pilus assembly pilin Flp
MNLMNNLGLRLALAFRGLSLAAVEPEEGQTLAEYALILTLIAAVTITIILALGHDISKIFSGIASAL